MDSQALSPVYGNCSVHVSYGYSSLLLLLLVVLLLILLSFCVIGFCPPTWVCHVWALLLDLKHFLSDSDSLLPNHLFSAFLIWTLHAWILTQMFLGPLQVCFLSPDLPLTSVGVLCCRTKPSLVSPLCPIVFQYSKPDLHIHCFAYAPLGPVWYQMLIAWHILLASPSLAIRIVYCDFPIPDDLSWTTPGPASFS